MTRRMCSEPGCGRMAAYQTRTRPARCLEHIRARLAASNMRLLSENIPRATAWLRCQCDKCGVAADYRLETMDDRIDANQTVCDACRWTEWRRLPGLHYQWTDLQLRDVAASHGWRVVEVLDDVRDGATPILVDCEHCGRRSIERIGDLGFGCSCTSGRVGRNPAPPQKRGRGAATVGEVPAMVAWLPSEEQSDETRLAMRVNSTVRLVWECPKAGHRFEESPRNLWAALRLPGPACSECADNRRREWALQRTMPVMSVPQLAAAWYDDDVDPDDLLVGDRTLVRWRCPAGHQPRMFPETYLGGGCPTCRSKDRLAQECLSVTDPEMASQWVSEANGRWTPESIRSTSKRAIWWMCDECGHRWQESPVDRTKRPRWRCPVCHSYLGSLAYTAPELADEWSSDNPQTPWQVFPTSQTHGYVPEWVCHVNPAHRWHATLGSRWSGSGCPECRLPGKSKIELTYYAVVARHFADARSGVSLRDAAFAHNTVWRPDIICRHGVQRLAIEYDGSFWHQEKLDTDRAKTQDLLAAGWYVIRIREQPLPFLPLHEDRLLQIHADPSASPEWTCARIQAWMEQSSEASKGTSTPSQADED